MRKKDSKRPRKVKMRSYRKARQLLLAFGSAGLVLGVVLVGFSSVKGHEFLIGVGIVYILVSTMLFGISGVLGHLDEIGKRRRLPNGKRVQNA